MNMIEVKNLTKKFGHFMAVGNVSFDVENKEIFGLLSSNGTVTIAIWVLTSVS